MNPIVADEHPELELQFFDSESPNREQFSMKFPKDSFRHSLNGMTTIIDCTVECTYDVEDRRRRLIVNSVPVIAEAEIHIYPEPCLNPLTEVGQYVEVPC